MLNVHTLCLGSYQTNCYIVHHSTSKSCVVIDPGYEPDTILNFLREKELTVDAILLTHGHFDHVGAVEGLVKATGCRLWMNQGDYSMESNPMNDYLYPLHDTKFTEVNFCEDFEKIEAGGLSFTTVATAGHSWGSVCYQCEDVLFSGDTLFAGSCGRTDLPGGDWITIGESLKSLAAIKENYRVYPGHGPSTTLLEEKQSNPYL